MRSVAVLILALSAVGYALVKGPASATPPAASAEPPVKRAAPPVAPYSDWPTYHGGYSLTGSTDAAISDAPIRLWRYRADGPVVSAPISGNGRIYVTTTRGTLLALDLLGNPLWCVDLPGESVNAPPLYADESVVVGSITGNVTAFDAASGRKKWSSRVCTGIQGSLNRIDLPGGIRGVFAVSQAEGSIHVVDLGTGDPICSSGDTQRCDGAAGTARGRIVLGTCGSTIQHFTMNKSARMSGVGLEPDNQIAGGVAVSGSTAFAGTRKGRLVAVDLEAGKLLWSTPDGRGESFGTPAVDDRFVVYGTSDGTIHGVRRETGVPVWEFDSVHPPSAPVIAGNRVVATARGLLFILDLESGRKVWDSQVSDELSSPAIVGGWIIVGADDGTVTAFGRE